MARRAPSLKVLRVPGAQCQSGSLRRVPREIALLFLLRYARLTKPGIDISWMPIWHESRRLPWNALAGSVGSLMKPSFSQKDLNKDRTNKTFKQFLSAVTRKCQTYFANASLSQTTKNQCPSYTFPFRRRPWGNHRPAARPQAWHFFHFCQGALNCIDPCLHVSCARSFDILLNFVFLFMPC